MVALGDRSDPNNPTVLQCVANLFPSSQLVPGLTIAVTRVAVSATGVCTRAEMGNDADGGAAGRGGGGRGDDAIADADAGTSADEGQGSHENGGHEGLDGLHFGCMSFFCTETMMVVRLLKERIGNKAELDFTRHHLNSMASI